MPFFDVTMACDVPTRARVRVQANSAEEAQNEALMAFKWHGDLNMISNWKDDWGDAHNHRTIDMLTTEIHSG